ncbi:MAG: hypothetical protein E6496_13680, partial [Lachnoanaerobaculum sp.]|nr:hypothetical protein [Lachnoanaerobaculum sp.]
MKRKFLVGFITAIFISGCGIKTSGISENIKINLSENKLGYNYSQMLIPALSESQIMTDTYTDAIWDSYVDKDTKFTFRDNFYNDLKNYYKELVVLKRIAENENIT